MRTIRVSWGLFGGPPMKGVCLEACELQSIELKRQKDADPKKGQK